jgi:hypothetical protein
MAGTVTSVYSCETSLRVFRLHAKDPVVRRRTRPGKSDRSATHVADCFLGGATPIQTCH